jgi:hypothetical protein
MKHKDFWPDHLISWSASGMSKRAYCLKHSLSYASFMYHSKRAEPPQAYFQQVELAAPTPEVPMMLHFPDGIRLSFPSSALPEVFASLNR